jgi:hypothetical protein
MLSRLESGRTQRMNSTAQLDALAKALGLDSDLDFILGAYAPKLIGEARGRRDTMIEVLPPGPEGEIIALVRQQDDTHKRRALEVLRAIFSESD